MKQLKYIIAAIVIIVIIAVILLVSGKEDTIVLTGLAETNQIDVSSKIAGRITRLMVKEGDIVNRGDTLLLLESKELDAKIGQGKGLMDAAFQKYNMAQNGARPEEIEAAGAMMKQAKAQYALAEKTYNRVKKLYEEQVVSEQEKDQAEMQWKAAEEITGAATARYNMAKKGARKEEINGAEALYRQAENTYGEIQAAYRELSIISPVNGEVFKKLNDPGEIIPAGYPVLTLIDPADMYITVSVREDLLSFFSKGKEVQVSIPALKLKDVRCKVSYIAPMGDFATWKATNQKGDFDLKTFEIRLLLVEKITELRPGMTVRITL